jgi:hypothetical protein
MNKKYLLGQSFLIVDIARVFEHIFPFVGPSLKVSRFEVF